MLKTLTMKLLKNSTLLFIAFAFILTASCKKYPDGPLLSLRTKEHRVVGDWNVEYFSINGYDSTAYLKGQLYYGYYSFSKENEGRAGYTYNSYNHQYGAGGQWYFDNGKRILRIDSGSESAGKHFNLGAFAADKVSWVIRRLTEKEMWLKANYTDGREYFVKLEQKKV
jgi:hypothetical protein